MSAMIARLVIAGALVGIPAGATADVTFYQDVLPLMERHCHACHGSALANLGSARPPMTLVTFEDVRPWARTLVRAVQRREMPPWLASRESSGRFLNERALTDAEIAVFVAWQRAGLPAGTPRPGVAASVSAPRTVSADRPWAIGPPDVVASFAEPYILGDEVRDETVHLNTAEVPADMWVRAIEFRPGSPAVHHMCAAAVAPPGTVGADREIALGCAAAGTIPFSWPDGYALFLPKGATVRFSMHYHKSAGHLTAIEDMSEIGFVLDRSPVRQRVFFNAVHNTTFEIPPGRTGWKVGAARVLLRDTTLLALWPHAHLRGAAARYWVVHPDGSEEELLHVPRYDQGWQEVYVFHTPKALRAGSRIEAQFTYDNSPERARQAGFDATRTVQFGPETHDEMMLAYIAYTESGPQPATPSLALRDSVDADRLLRTTAVLPAPRVELNYSRLPWAEVALRAHAARPSSEVVTFATAAAIKLKVQVPLRAGDLDLSANVPYALWLERTGRAWALAVTADADVWGTQFDPAAVLARVPLVHAEATDGDGPLGVTVTDPNDSVRVEFGWGRHSWIADLRHGSRRSGR